MTTNNDASLLMAASTVATLAVQEEIARESNKRSAESKALRDAIALIEKMAKTPVDTLTGVNAKRSAIMSHTGGDACAFASGYITRLNLSLLRDIERLAA